MTLTNVQASIAALIAQLIALAVGFGWVNNTQAGLIGNAVTAALGTAFILANAWENSTKAQQQIAQQQIQTARTNK